MIKQGSARYPVTEVVLHCMAVPTGWHRGKSVNDLRALIDEWHKERGWRGIGYHRVIAPNGDIATGRNLYEVGAGVAGHNRGVIHIVMCEVAKINRMGEFDDFYTNAQRVALRDYLLELEELHGAPLKVSGHNDYADKLCPGFPVVQDEWV